MFWFGLSYTLCPLLSLSPPARREATDSQQLLNTFETQHSLSVELQECLSTPSIYTLPHLLFSERKTQHRGSTLYKHSHLYSNINCTPTNRQKTTPRMNSIPPAVPTNSLKKNRIPSAPTTKPTRFAVIMRRMLMTPPRAQACRYHGAEAYWRNG